MLSSGSGSCGPGESCDKSEDSGDGVASVDFQLSLEGAAGPGAGGQSGQERSTPSGRCPLCMQQRQVFYCAQCLRNGDFVHSTAHCTDRFADKRLKLIRLKTDSKHVEEHCCKLLRKRSEKENLVLEIRKSKDRIDLLQMAVRQKKENVAENRSKLKVLGEIVHQKKVKMPTYKDNLERICKHVNVKKSVLERQNDYIDIELEALKVLRQQRLKQLTQYVFPKQEVHKSLDQNFSNASTETALAEASRPTRIFEKNNGLLPLKMLDIVLPLDGDYSSYCNWVAANKGITVSNSNSNQTEPIKQNPAYRISAILAYCAQLVRILAFYLDVRLPFNISYSDFCSCELEEKRFKRYVWRLQICAAYVLEAAGAFRGYNKNNLREPPLHMLLRASPLSLYNCIQGEEFYSHIFDEDIENIDPPKRIWWGGDDVEGVLAGASDDEGSELTENLQWDWETIGTETGQTAQRVQSPTGGFTPTGAGLVTSAAASIASLFRGWKAK